MQPNTAVLQILVAALPDAALRPLLVELVLGGAMAAAPLASATETKTPAPARIRRGWPRGVPRGPRKQAAVKRTRAQLDQLNAKRKAARAAAKATVAKPNGGNGSSPAAEPTPAQTLWQHAEKLQPKAPWRAIVREFGINEAVAQDAHRTHKLPPGITGDAVTRFLELPAG
jgi:hypothetical protein